MRRSLSGNGRYVAFTSDASNLVAGDTNGRFDIFVRDRVAGTTARVSVGPGGAQADGSSTMPAISTNGRFVVFISDATNLVSGDTNGVTDTFVYDRQSRTTERVSVSSGGDQGDARSGNSSPPAISADGRYVAFGSEATNLIADDTNGSGDVFVRDRQAGTTERVSVGTGGVQTTNGGSYMPAIPGDGQYVAFVSLATSLVLPGGTNMQVYVHDRLAGTTEQASVTSDGSPAHDVSYNVAISADGRYVSFQSPATNLVVGDTNHAHDVFVHDRQTDATRRVDVGLGGKQAVGGYSNGPAPFAGKGRFVAFTSDATNLVRGDTNGVEDIFVRDLGTAVARPR